MVDKLNKEQLTELLDRISNLKGTPVHSDLIRLLNYRLDKAKDELVNSAPEDFLVRQGKARAYNEMIADLQRVPLKQGETRK